MLLLSSCDLEMVEPAGDAFDAGGETGREPAPAALDVTSTRVADGAGEVALPPPACLQVSPSAVYFGGKIYGEMAVRPLTLTSCGEDTLQIDAVFVTDGSSPDFDVERPWDTSPASPQNTRSS